jgi:hypothetical protein
MSVPPPPPAIRSVRHLGEAPAARSSLWTLIGQDGGQTIDLGDEVLFTFCDTLLAIGDPAGWPENRWPFPRHRGRFLANCAAKAPRGSIESSLASLAYYQGVDGYPREIIVPTVQEAQARIRFWPEHGVVVDGKVYLYYLGIQHQDPTNSWAFVNLGTGLAILDPETGAAARQYWDDDWRLVGRLNGADLHGGVQILREEETVYVFGAVRDSLGPRAHLARVPANALADRTAYQHLESHEPVWGDQEGRSLDLGPCGNEFSVSYNPHLQSYLMCYADGFQSTLFMRKAAHPWGPYSAPAAVTELRLDSRNQLIAFAFEHPLFATDGGRTVFVTYCQANFAQNRCVAVTFA